MIKDYEQCTLACDGSFSGEVTQAQACKTGCTAYRDGGKEYCTTCRCVEYKTYALASACETGCLLAQNAETGPLCPENTLFVRFKSNYQPVCEVICNEATQWKDETTEEGECFNIAACSPDTQYILAHPTTTSDTVCAKALVCGPAQVELLPPTTTTDRVCMSSNISFTPLIPLTASPSSALFVSPVAAVPLDSTASEDVRAASTSVLSSTLPSTQLSADLDVVVLPSAAASASGVLVSQHLYPDSSSVQAVVQAVTSVGSPSDMTSGTAYVQLEAGPQLAPLLVQSGQAVAHNCTCTFTSSALGICSTSSCTVPATWLSLLPAGTSDAVTARACVQSTAAAPSPWVPVGTATIHAPAAPTPDAGNVVVLAPVAPTRPGQAIELTFAHTFDAAGVGGFRILVTCLNASVAQVESVQVDSALWDSVAAGLGSDKVSIGATLRDGVDPLTTDVSTLFTAKVRVAGDADLSPGVSHLALSTSVIELLDGRGVTLTPAGFDTFPAAPHVYDLRGTHQAVPATQQAVALAPLQPVVVLGALSWAAPGRVLNTAPLTGAVPPVVDVATKIVTSDGSVQDPGAQESVSCKLRAGFNSTTSTNTNTTALHTIGQLTPACTQLQLSSSMISPGGLALVALNISSTRGRSEPLVLSTEAEVHVWWPQLPVAVHTEPSVLRPIRGWTRSCSVGGTSTPSSWRWQTASVRVSAQFSCGPDMLATPLDITALVQAGITSSNTSVLRRPEDPWGKDGYAPVLPNRLAAYEAGEALVLVRQPSAAAAAQAGDGGEPAVLGQAAVSTTVQAATDTASTIAIKGLDTGAVSQISMSATPGAEAGWLEPIQVDIQAAVHALQAEGEQVSLYASLVLEDDWREPLMPGVDVAFATLSASDVVVLSDNSTAQVVAGAAAGARELVQARLSAAHSCVPAVSANVTLDLDLPAVAALHIISAPPPRLVPSSDLAAEAGVPTSFALRVQAAYDDGTVRDVSADDRLQVTTAAATAAATQQQTQPGQEQDNLVDVTRQQDGSYVIAASAFASGGVQTVLVTFDASDALGPAVNTSLAVTVTTTTNLATATYAHPAWTSAGVASLVPKAVISAINGTIPTRYQQLKLQALLSLSDGHTFVVQDSLVMYAVRYNQVSDPLWQNLSSSVLEPPVPAPSASVSVRAVRVGTRAVGTGTEANVTIATAPVYVTRLYGMTTTAGSSLHAQRGQAAGFVTLSASLSDGTELVTLFDSGAALYPGLVLLSSDDPTAVQVSSATGQLTLLDNAPGAVGVRAAVVATPAFEAATSASVDVTCNLMPEVGDIDMGAESGAPLPADVAVGTTVGIEVRANTGTTPLGSFALALYYDATVAGFVSATAGFEGTLETADNGMGTLRLSGLLVSEGSAGSGLAVVQLVFEARSAGAFVFEGSVESLLDRQLPSQSIAAVAGQDVPGTMVAGRVWFVAGSTNAGTGDRRRRAAAVYEQEQEQKESRERRADGTDPADIDGDGVFTIGDAFFTLQYTVQEPLGFATAAGAVIQAILDEDEERRRALDTDRDGVVLLRDAVLQSRIVTGKAVFMEGVPRAGSGLFDGKCALRFNVSLFDVGYQPLDVGDVRVFFLVDALNGGDSSSEELVPGVLSTAAQWVALVPQLLAVYEPVLSSLQTEGGSAGVAPSGAVLVEASGADGEGNRTYTFEADIPVGVASDALGASVFVVRRVGDNAFVTFFSGMTTGTMTVPVRRIQQLAAPFAEVLRNVTLDSGRDAGYNTMAIAQVGNTTRVLNGCISACAGAPQAGAYYDKTSNVCTQTAACAPDTQYILAHPTTTSDTVCANVTVSTSTTPSFRSTSTSHSASLPSTLPLTTTSLPPLPNSTNTSTASPGASAIAALPLPETSSLATAIQIFCALLCIFSIAKAYPGDLWPLFFTLAVSHLYMALEAASLSKPIFETITTDGCLAVATSKLALFFACLG